MPWAVDTAMRFLRTLLMVTGVWLGAAPVLDAQEPAAVPAQPRERRSEVERPTVRLIATGGTIANQAGGRLTADELVALVPSLDRHALVETEQFANLPSSSLTVDQWLALARRVNAQFAERPGLAGIVVTSGTDTLEETAYFLNLTVKSDRPVVVVGAMRMPGDAGYDGTANLLHGVRVAASPASRDRGVVVVLNNAIHAARDVRKTHAQRLDSFDSGPQGVLGVVDADRVVYYRRPGRRHTRRTEFDVSTIALLPRVDIVMSYLGAPGDLITAARERGAEGLVIAAGGAGSTTPSQLDAIDALLEDGVVVVITTRTGAGRVPARRPRRNEPEAPFAAKPVAGEDLSPVKARVLLMLALAETRDGAEIQRMFSVY